MVGPLTPSDPGADLALDVAPKQGISGFLETTIGKIVVGAVMVIVLAAALGVIAYFYFLNQEPEESGVVIPPTSAVTTSTTDPVAVPTQRPSPRLENNFTFRNIFRPTVRPAIAASSTTEASGTTTINGVVIPPDTLYLQGVTVVDGRDVATLLWNGQTFTSGQGDVLTGTPWQVQSIEGNTVVMLFGDSRVTLVVGQGVGK